MVRLPPDVSDEVEEDPTGSKAIWDRGLLSGASQKVCDRGLPLKLAPRLICNLVVLSLEVGYYYSLQAEVLCSYHVGETVNSIHRSTLIPGGSELIVYTTLSGAVGMLVPFTSREVSVVLWPTTFYHLMFDLWTTRQNINVTIVPGYLYLRSL